MFSLLDATRNTELQQKKVKVLSVEKMKAYTIYDWTQCFTCASFYFFPVVAIILATHRKSRGS